MNNEMRQLLAIEGHREFTAAVQHFVKPEKCLTVEVLSERYQIAAGIMFAIFIDITAQAHNNYDPAALRELCVASFDKFFQDPHNRDMLEKRGAAMKGPAAFSKGPPPK